MSTARYGFDTVPINTLNPSVPVNDLMRLLDAIIDSVAEAMDLSAPPTTTDADIGKVWIPKATATGAWAGHDTELALCTAADAWLFIPAPEGKRLRNHDDGTDYVFDGSAWNVESGGGSEDISLVTEASAFTASVASHAGRGRLVLAGGDVTFDNAEGYSEGKSFNIRSTDALSLVEDGVTLTPPAGGTLELDAGMAVTVIITGSTTGIVIGQTVAA